jgi:hypothetical protein
MPIHHFSNEASLSFLGEAQRIHTEDRMDLRDGGESFGGGKDSDLRRGVQSMTGT